MKAPLLVVFALVAVGAQSEVPPPGTALAGRAWSTPRPLATRASSWFPEVVSDPAGGVHAFWATGDRFGDFVGSCELTSGCDSEEIVAKRAGADGAYTTRPAAVVDGSGWLHLLWRAKSEIVYQRLFLPDPEEGWSGPPLRLGAAAFPAIAAGADGTLHAIEARNMFGAEQKQCFGCGDIHYHRSTDGGASWTPGVNLSQTVDGSDKPQFAIGPRGDLALAWEEGHDFYIGKGKARGVMIAVSHDGGVSWDPPVTFEDQADPPHSPALGFDRNGALLLVWRQSVAAGLFFRRSLDQGRTWSEPARIEGVLPRHHAPDELDNLAMAADAAGHLHLLATGRISPELTTNALFHVEWNGEAWMPPIEIFRTGGAAEWPRVAVRGGNELHAVWFERPEGHVWDSERGGYRIWYANFTSDAPPVALKPWPKHVRPLINPRKAAVAAQTAGAFLIVGGVVWWARRRGL